MSRAQIEAVLTEHPEIEAAYLFGSLAKNTATPHSDMDLAIYTTDKLTTEATIQLIGELGEITGRPIDLIDLRQVGEPLLGEILRDGIRLKGSNFFHAELIKRHLFDSADFLPYVERMLAERRQRWNH